MTIDVHGHITSPELFSRFPMPPSLVDVDGMVELKAAAGITMSIVGSPVGAGTMVRAPGLDNYRQPPDRLEAFHEWLAGQVRDHSTALRAYVYVNPLGSDEELAAAAARIEQDEFVGLMVNSSVNGSFLDTPRADAFFAMAAEHGAPVMLHPPAEPAGSGQLSDLRLVEQIARPCDVTLGTAAVIFAGWLEKYQNLRLIAPVCGGGLSLLLERLEVARHMPPGFGRPRAAAPPSAPAAGPPTGPSVTPLAELLPRIFVDTATPSVPAIAAAVRAFGPGNVMLGTDTPPMGAPLGAALARLDALGLPPKDVEAIRHRNAERLFGLVGHESVSIPSAAQSTTDTESEAHV
ncbi:amidohydrolase family protein [Streptomyces sp. NPDC049954]|uniref:amidohydrolase family protein n=1 Tax=Streptomyces sp. NPDC049954 TaxID=3155779 RepID=UPI00341FA05B